MLKKDRLCKYRRMIKRFLRKHKWIFSNDLSTAELENLQSYAMGYQNEMYKNLKGNY